MTKAHWFAHSRLRNRIPLLSVSMDQSAGTDCEYTVNPKTVRSVVWICAPKRLAVSWEHLTTVPTNEFAEANLFPLSHVLTWSTWQNLLLLRIRIKRIGQLKEANRHSLFYPLYKISNVCKTADNKMVTTAIPDTKPTAPEQTEVIV